MTVATHIHLVPRLRMHGAIFHIPHVPSQCAPTQPYLYYKQNHDGPHPVLRQPYCLCYVKANKKFYCHVKTTFWHVMTSLISSSAQTSIFFFSNFITQKACINQDSPWHLLCSGVWQKEQCTIQTAVLCYILQFFCHI